MQQGRRGRVLLAMSGYRPQRWYELMAARRDVTMEPDGPGDPSIDYAVVWKHRPGILAGLPNLKAIFSVGAGVDDILGDADLPDVPIVRSVVPNLTQHMTEYVMWRVFDHHRQGMLYRRQQDRRVWSEPRQRTAEEVHVGIMGLGELGGAAARALIAAGFMVNGWSRREKRMPGVSCFHGPEGLSRFLPATDILVVLLPLTSATTGIIDHALLGQLRKDNQLGGAVLINAGRGRLQKEDEILRALDDGTLKEASLDVFEEEPLPKESPLWAHPRVFVTPHAAATSDPEHLAAPLLDQMDACDRGEPLRNVIDRGAEY